MVSSWSFSRFLKLKKFLLIRHELLMTMISYQSLIVIIYRLANTAGGSLITFFIFFELLFFVSLQFLQNFMNIMTRQFEITIGVFILEDPSNAQPISVTFLFLLLKFYIRLNCRLFLINQILSEIWQRLWLWHLCKLFYLTHLTLFWIRILSIHRLGSMFLIHIDIFRDIIFRSHINVIAVLIVS